MNFEEYFNSFKFTDDYISSLVKSNPYIDHINMLGNKKSLNDVAINKLSNFRKELEHKEKRKNFKVFNYSEKNFINFTEANIKFLLYSLLHDNNITTHFKLKILNEIKYRIENDIDEFK